MNLEQFQKQRLEAYFTAHATDEQKSRRAERELTIDGAYKRIAADIANEIETHYRKAA